MRPSMSSNFPLQDVTSVEADPGVRRDSSGPTLRSLTDPAQPLSVSVSVSASDGPCGAARSAVKIGVCWSTAVGRPGLNLSTG
jgi:hypothetical protein